MKVQKTRRAVLVNKYPYIVRWCRIMGSYEYYLMSQLEKAETTKAPTNATYYCDTLKKWRTTDDVTAPSTRYDLGLEPIIC